MDLLINNFAEKYEIKLNRSKVQTIRTTFRRNRMSIIIIRVAYLLVSVFEAVHVDYSMSFYCN